MGLSWPFLTKSFPGLCRQPHGEGTNGPFPPNLGTFGKQNRRATLLSFYLLLVPQPTESVLQELECVGEEVSPGKNWVEHTALLYKNHNQKQQCSKS